MRTILFKGKRKDNGEWVEGNLLNESTIRDHRKGSLVETVNCSTECKFSCDGFIVDPSTVCQYTGLTESYERTKEYEPLQLWQHDIIEIAYEEKRIVCSIEWEICGFILVSKDFADGYIWLTDVIDWEDEDIWIIGSRKLGNIHDKK